MTADRDFKRRIRDRMARTGERYTTARAHLLATPREPDAPRTVGRGGGRTPETAALARALGARNLTAPHTGQPWNEAALLGLGGGIGMAYFTFAYAEMTTLYVGGRINDFVLGGDFLELAARRAGTAPTVLTTSGAKTAERQLRGALDAGHPVIALVDRTLLPGSGLPTEARGTMPHPVVVTRNGDADGTTLRLIDVDDAYDAGWEDLAAARAAYRPGKHRLYVFDQPVQPVDLAGAVVAAVAATVAGMVAPPRSNFGLTGLDRWAEALVDRGAGGWSRLFGDSQGLADALGWLVFWIETSGTGGGAYRRLYAEFLEEVAAAGAATQAVTDALADAAARYRRLATDWTALAEAAAADEAPGPDAAASLRDDLAERVRLLRAAEAEAVAVLRPVG